MAKTLEYRTIVLSDNAYDPRRLPDGGLIYDIMPWEGATDYVIRADGRRFGILWDDETVSWLGFTVAEAFGDDVTLVEDL